MANIDKKLILEEILKQLDISPTMYQLAVDRYTGVAKYLNSKGLNANFYPQGSFRLGTVTRPIRKGADSEYDIDLVCQINVEKNKTSPSIIKNTVGNLLKENATYKEILDDEGKRCWTLLYAEKDGIGFHLDILPSVNESEDIVQELTKKSNVDIERASSAIAITDKKDSTYSWVSSNPIGYADWFNEINQLLFKLIEKSAKAHLYENSKDIFASIDDVPSYLVKTPLQRVIQILKRHRDIRFNGHELEHDKPISMIITTLSALIVKNGNCLTTDTFTLLNFIVSKLTQYAELIKNPNISQSENAIIKRDVATSKWYIPNPVNPNENFADRWHENNDTKAKAFFDWVKWVSHDLIVSFNNPQFDINSIKGSFGKDVVEKAYEKFKNSKPVVKDSKVIIPTVNITQPGKPWGK